MHKDGVERLVILFDTDSRRPTEGRSSSSTCYLIEEPLLVAKTFGERCFGVGK